MCEDAYPFQNPQLSIEERVDDLVGRMTLQEKIAQLGNVSPAIERLGVPEYDWWNECLHGVGRAGRATVFPQAIGIAATWDIPLVGQIAKAISDEARAKYHAAGNQENRGRYMGLTYWSPNINILRDPRWGRAQETFGEDPYLTSRIGVEFVKGLQGDDPKYLKLVGTPKHYAVHSGPEEGRHAFNAIASEKDLWETYLPAFEATICEAGAWSIMGAYNRLNGEACNASPTLLTKILRKKWNFQGFVVSDCGAIENIYNHHKMVDSMAAAAAFAVREGCDLCCGTAYDALPEAVEKGLITEQEITTSAKRLFTARMKLGMFDPDDLVPYSAIPESVVDGPEHRALARKTGVESMVLLKNDGILPLKKHWGLVYVTGPNADAQDVLLGNYNGYSASMTTILEGIVGKVSVGTRVGFSAGSTLRGPAQESFGPLGWDGPKADLIIACVGLSPKLEGEEGEAAESDGNGDKGGVELPDSQVSLLKFIDTFDKPIVIVLTGGSPMRLPEGLKNVKAILLAWYPGAEGGNSVADVLFGDENPSGRLPVSFPGPDTIIPLMDSYDMQGRTYRFATSPYLYPFGYGLSYTTFKYETPKVSSSKISAGESVTVSVSITNAGSRDGEEVVQVYVRDLEATTRVPIHKLVAFGRTQINAGETKSIEFTLDKAAFELVYDDGSKGIEAGLFDVFVGGGQPLDDKIKSVRLEVTA